MDGPGEFVNTLDPVLRLYDAAGNPVAFDDNGATDGRNSLLTFTPPADGTYYIEVTSAGGTKGEYVLSVDGTTATWPPFQVTSVSPPDGIVLNNPPSQITVSTNGNILLPTLQGMDLTVNGLAAAAVTPDNGSTATFTARPAIKWSAADGGNDHYYLLSSNAETWTDAETEAVALGGHLVSINSQGEEEFINRAFRSGVQRGRVLWIGLNDSVNEGDFVWSSEEPVTYLDFHSGEPNDGYGSGEDYVALNWIRDGGDWNDTTNDNYGTPLKGIIELDGQPADSWLASEGSHTVAIAAGAISNVQGTGIDPFSSSFTLDTTAPRSSRRRSSRATCWRRATSALL